MSQYRKVHENNFLMLCSLNLFGRFIFEFLWIFMNRYLLNSIYLMYVGESIGCLLEQVQINGVRSIIVRKRLKNAIPALKVDDVIAMVNKKRVSALCYLFTQKIKVAFGCDQYIIGCP